MLDPKTIGEFVDRVVSNAQAQNDNNITRRTNSAVAGRFIEEAVELGLAAGLTSADIMSHVMDSIHNQCGKAGRREGRVIYPSQFVQPFDPRELAEEIADCSLVLKDLAFISGTDIDVEEDLKWSVFSQRKFNVSSQGTLYAIK